MQVYELREPGQLVPRSHPWIGSAADPAHRYVDFVVHPELIRDSLEDLSSWQAYRSTETFYRLIETLNGPGSVLMTNDCAFSGPAPNTGSHSQRRFESSGRVMVLFRDLALNTGPARVYGLAQQVAAAVAPMEPGFEDGIIGASIVDANFTTLVPPRPGKQLLLSFWSWGDDPLETLLSMDRTLTSLLEAVKTVSVVSP
jgi:hypothetical protein